VDVGTRQSKVTECIFLL